MVIKFENKELNNPTVTQGTNVGGNNNDYISTVEETRDGGYIAGGYFSSITIQVGDNKLTSKGSTDGLLVKYSREGKVEWATNVGGSSIDYINSVAETRDGGYIAGGYFSGTIKVGDNKLTSQNQASMIIKYNSQGEVEWAKQVTEEASVDSIKSTTDGGFIVIDSSTNMIESSSNIIKYSSEGEVEWATSVGGSGYDYIKSVEETRDGGYIAGGYFYGNIQVGDITLESIDGNDDGMLIKYSSEGEVEWATSVGGSSSDYIYSVAGTSDGGYIAGGYFYSSKIQVGDTTLTSNGNQDGMLIKYKQDGTVEWAKNMGGTRSDDIYQLVSNSDGSFIVKASFRSSIQIGNYKLNKGSAIIKYKEDGSIEWAKNVGGTITSIDISNNGTVLLGGYFSGTYTIDNVRLESNGTTDGMILKIANNVGVPEIQELTVENNRKEFKITTDVNEIDGVKGGTISGEDEKPYETVKYGDNSTKEIIMEPEESYEIISITLNGQEYPFTENEDGTYTMPLFENVTEDKHIEVTYSLKDNKITINKVDSVSKNALPGAKFKLDQIEERSKPETEKILGDIEANGKTYKDVDTANETAGVLGDLINNGTYYFVENENGTLTPTNSKTYQTANGGSTGIQNTTANSYMKIDLTGKQGTYAVVVNARIYSESADYGYASITNTTTAPAYNNSTDRFIYMSGTSSTVTTSENYTSKALTGGNVYYLHLGYRKDSSVDTGEDQIVINSVKVYELTKDVTYNFVENNGTYESNNQRKDGTVANSYIPIDLTQYTGKYNLTVNAKVSSQSSNDYGYATVTNTTTAPSYSSSTGQFIKISGTVSAKDYTTVLQGGQKYYLHLGYYKNASTSTGEDKFTVNSINISLNDSELYHTEVETNSEGQAITQIPFGKYNVTEIMAPEGYEPIEEPIEIEFRADGVHEFTIENEKIAKVIVHHYLKDNEGNYTTTKIAEDDILQDKQGEKYTTQPHTDIAKYQLEKDSEGNYVTPADASGIYTYEDIEVTYYYEEKDIPLTVHHYIQGTTQEVELADGKTAQDETYEGKQGEPYTTSAISPEKLNPKYELVETPVNFEGTYEGEEIIVTYYYKVKEFNITTKVEGEGGSISGESQIPYEIVEYGEDSIKEILITPEENYKISTITINGQEIEFITNDDGTYVVSQFKNMTENKEIIVTFEKMPTSVVIHHYIYNKETGEYTNEKVPEQDGSLAQDDVISGVIGDMYASREKQNLQANYELYSIPENASGIMTKQQIEATYYYVVKDAQISSSITKTGTDHITVKDEQVSYNINYTANINTYIGNAEVTIVDTLPYEIDENKSTLDEGSYNPVDRTITWTETIENINTIVDGEKQININKNITVVYSGINTNDETFTNTVIGRIKLNTTIQEQETQPAETITTTEYKVDKTVEKTWDHTNNIYGNPTRVILQIKNGESIVGEQQVGEADNWSYTFTNLPKYDVNGNEIDYTAGEKEVSEGELSYYKSEVNGLTIKNTYNGPIISASKEITTDNGLGYVVQGEKITYTVRVENTGGVEKDVLVQDSIPTGTTFVEGSIKINDEKTSKTMAELTTGITVNVPAKSNATVSFEVTVNNLTQEELAENTAREITNTATVDGKTTNEVKTAIVTYEKKAEILRQTDEEISEGAVTAGDIIKYTIRVNNLRNEKIQDIKVKDIVPEGTTIKTINNEGKINDQKEISWNIAEIQGMSNVEVSFEVTVNYSNSNRTITNVATVDDKTTNETITPYEITAAKLNSSITKTGTEKITDVESKVNYVINYTATIKDFVGKGKVTLVDTLPYEIDEENSSLNGGKYNSTDRTITWEEDLGNIDTYTNGDKEVKVAKSITVKYNYTDENTLSGTITNNVKGKIVLTQPNPEKEENPDNPDIPDEIVVEEQERQTQATTSIEIPTKVIVHHYIYDEETNTYTTVKIVEDETINGIIGQNYNTSKSSNVRSDYICINETPDKYTGIMTKDTIEVIYYYKLKTPVLETNISKTAKVVNSGVGQDTVLTSENGEIKYTITENIKLTDYKGKVTVQIVDKLPAKINESSSTLDGGSYDQENQTITWTQEINVDGSYSQAITKNIKLVYIDQDLTKSLVNEVTGTVKIYYPDIDINKPGEVRDTKENKATSEVTQLYIVSREVDKVWDDNNNAKGRRPGSVTVQLTANGETTYKDKELEKVILNKDNEWKHTFGNLPKYDDNGVEIVYGVLETETKEKDLEFYEEPVYEGDTHITITNKYKMMNTDLNSTLDKTGPDEIKSSNEVLEYNIVYNGTITNYIGKAKVTLVDYLPYGIDVNNKDTNLADGIYNPETKTITWTQDIDHINTYTNGDYKIEINKTIKLVYTNIDVKAESMVNTARVTVDLYETETTNTQEKAKETKINIPGTVIVKYVDKDTKKEISNGKTITGKAGTHYETDRKDIYGYKYEHVEGNVIGEIPEGISYVTYYYSKIPSGGVIVKYEDEDGNEISEEVKIQGSVGEKYATEQKEIENYEFVRVEGVTSGEMTEEVIEVTYIYKKIPARVIVRYLEKIPVEQEDDTQEDGTDEETPSQPSTGDGEEPEYTIKELLPEDIIEGWAGDKYNTERKEIPNYRQAEPEPDNKEGIMTKEDIYVTYYYEKIPSGIVTVKYMDIDTNEEIMYKVEKPEESSNGETDEYKTYREQLQGYCGDEYKTEEKQIPYYNIVVDKIPENKEGVYTQEDIEVIYYYRKQIFNIGIDKTITKVVVNGEEKRISDNKLAKIEVVGKQIGNTDIEITYKIKVTNTGEIKGTAVVEDKIPNYFKMAENNAYEWKENKNGNIQTLVELAPGESKDIEVILEWQRGENAFGAQTNIAEIIEVDNEANYTDTNEEDNKSMAAIILSVKTGNNIIKIVLLLLNITSISAAIVGKAQYAYVKIRKRRK